MYFLKQNSEIQTVTMNATGWKNRYIQAVRNRKKVNKFKKSRVTILLSAEFKKQVHGELSPV